MQCICNSFSVRGERSILTVTVLFSGYPHARGGCRICPLLSRIYPGIQVVLYAGHHGFCAVSRLLDAFACFHANLGVVMILALIVCRILPAIVDAPTRC